PLPGQRRGAARQHDQLPPGQLHAVQQRLPPTRHQRRRNDRRPVSGGLRRRGGRGDRRRGLLKVALVFALAAALFLGRGLGTLAIGGAGGGGAACSSWPACHSSQSAWTMVSIFCAASCSQPSGRETRSRRMACAPALPRWTLAVSHPMACTRQVASCSSGRSESSIFAQSGASRRTTQRRFTRTNGSGQRTALRRASLDRLFSPLSPCGCAQTEAAGARDLASRAILLPYQSVSATKRCRPRLPTPAIRCRKRKGAR